MLVPLVTVCVFLSISGSGEGGEWVGGMRALGKAMPSIRLSKRDAAAARTQNRYQRNMTRV